MKSPKVRSPLKTLALILAIGVMLSYLTVQFEDYRTSVQSDTEIYLGCRNFYYDKAWHAGHALKDAYSQRMCQDDWNWWNYEIYFHKLFKG